MSLRKSPTPTPALLAGNRRNAQLATGPSTPAGKENSSRNSRKHGLFARQGEDFRASLAALGENAEEFDRVYQGLLRAYQPADPLWARQVEDLARLYWRRARLDRAKAGLILHQQEKREQERQKEVMEDNRFTIDTFDVAVATGGMWRMPDSEAKYQAVLSHLQMIRAIVENQQFDESGKVFLRYLYGREPSWRGAKIQRDFEALADPKPGAILDRTLPLATLRQDLSEEIEYVRQQLAWWKTKNAPPSAAARDAALAPEGKQWALILREERDLDRAIDRKVKILLSLRRVRRSGADNGYVMEASETSGQEGPENTTDCQAVIAQK